MTHPLEGGPTVSLLPCRASKYVVCFPAALRPGGKPAYCAKGSGEAQKWGAKWGRVGKGSNRDLGGDSGVKLLIDSGGRSTGPRCELRGT